ncbi:MAG: Holliday junction branch migration protein RuvA [Clostridiales bacterium]|nr:Holliday junction branch migration protein RuvA [Clostridiales bacterium]
MISYIKGEIIYNGGDTMVVENNGIGYEVTVPAFSAQKLCAQSGIVTVYTYMSVREDGISLFGFASLEEKHLYEKLISVSGIGPKAAVSILGVMTPTQLITAIISSDAEAIARAPGIGKKTAQRVILDLKDKIGSEDMSAAFESGEDAAMLEAVTAGEDRSEAAEALISLGYTRSEAIKAVSKVYNESMDVQKILSAALRELSRL